MSSLLSLQKFLQISNQALYLSSFDYYLNEYVPPEDNLRRVVSGFTGSVAEMVVFPDKRAWLFVDGRYHEQADKEVDGKLIEVVKVPYGTSLTDALFTKLKTEGISDLCFVPERTSVSMMNQLADLCNLHPLSSRDIESVLDFKSLPEERDPVILSNEEMGEGRIERLNRLFDDESAFFTCALDSIAWLSGIRGFQLPYQATLRSYAFATKHKLYMFLSAANLNRLDNQKIEGVEFHHFDNMNDVLSKLSKNFRRIGIDPQRTNSHLYALVQKIFEAEFNLLPGFLTKEMAKKNSVEIEHFKAAFEKSDQAIYKTLCWLKEKVGDVSELDWYKQTTEYYQDQGMLEHSFKTISGFGENGSIIHYGTPSADKKLKNGDVCLLDSGAFYRDGYATDCTRTVLGRGEASDEQKKNYTLVLKAILAAMNAKFKEGTLGKEIDAITRAPIIEAGLNYAHGTGHGVGINVHEGVIP